MRESGSPPRWVRRGHDAVGDDLLERYRASDVVQRPRQTEERLLTALQWHPVAAGILLAFLLAFPLAPLAIGAGTTAGTVGVLAVCGLLVPVGAGLVRANLRRTLLPALQLLRPGAQVPRGIQPHLRYLASWGDRRDVEVGT